MRVKIIAVNAVIVLVVGLLSWVLLRAALNDVVSNPAIVRAEAEHAVAAANAKLELDSLRTERWLAAQAQDKGIRDAFKAGTVVARAEAATEASNKVKAAAGGSPIFSRAPAFLVALADDKGVTLGRDGSALMRNEDVGATHPVLKRALKEGVTASELWSDAKSSDSLLVSYAPVRDDGGQVLGAVLFASLLNDERLQRTSEVTSGRGLVLGIADGQSLALRAKSNGVSAELLASIGQGGAKDGALAALSSGNVTLLAGTPSDAVVAAAGLGGHGDAKRAVLLAVAPASLVESSMAVLWPLFGTTALGLVLVAISGFLLGAYISSPIAEIEEGLLAILNGKTELRFELEHAELGGLVFRLNSLLNQLMGVAEDDTDDEGRSSRPPNARDFESTGE